jgi:CRP/FNR family transcriptional regulator, cyclic AMP receptor protein
LSKSALQGLDALSSTASYPKGAILFVQGQKPRGVFVLCNGRVKMTASSAEGKSIILRIAGPGELIGLPGTLSGKPYAVTAEAFEPIQASFIARDPFLQFLREHGDAALSVAQILTEIYQATYREVRYLGLSGSAEGKLARFILDFTEKSLPSNGHTTATLTLTHEEIAEMIGTSRETVSRLFTTFKRKKLIEVRGATLVVNSKANLEKLAEA